MIFDDITTERLIVRAFTVDDLGALSAFYADEETMQFLGGTKPPEYAAEEFEHLQRGYASDGFGARAIERKADGVIVGRIGVWSLDLDIGHEIELGYLLGKDHRGQGYALEAATAVRDKLAAEGLRRVVSIVNPDNTAAVRAAMRVGMTRSCSFTWRDAPADLYVWTAKP